MEAFVEDGGGRTALRTGGGESAAAEGRRGREAIEATPGADHRGNRRKDK
jgi:hypothetical protein